MGFEFPASNHRFSPAVIRQLRKKIYKQPEDPQSVGWVEPKLFHLGKECGPLKLECGSVLPDVVVEYETYGTLSPAKDNAILITHALSGDAHVAGWDKTAGKNYRPWRKDVPGWWDNLVGPGLPFDTNRFFIICSNVLGSCYGTTGPASPNPEDGGRPYGQNFPAVTVGDWVKAQTKLVDYLGIKKLYAVCGGSLGGQQALEWAMGYPERVGKCIMLASGPRLQAQGLGFNHVATFAIAHDPKFRQGEIYSDCQVKNPLFAGAKKNLSYFEIADRNLASLTTARMLAHITYLSATGMEKKFGRKLQSVKLKKGLADVAGENSRENMEFAVHGYLSHQGEGFVNRFDANSYLLIAHAMDLYDAAQKWGNGDLARACSRIQAEMMVVSFSSDWLYPPENSDQIVMALLQVHHPVTSLAVESNYGHDAFLVEEERVTRFLRGFLSRSIRIPGQGGSVKRNRGGRNG